MFLSKFCSLGIAPLLATQAFAAVHERLTSVPSGWTVASTPDEGQAIVLQIGLQQQNLDQLEKRIYAVSTPGGSSYGQYMDRDDITAMLQPSADANDAVLAWLKQAGVTSVSSDGHWVNLATTVGKANKLLDAEFLNYDDGSAQKLRTLQYSVPDDLAEHVDLIMPTTFFGRTTAMRPTTPPLTKPLQMRQVVNASCADLITPQCLKEIYNITYVPDPKSGSQIGFGSFLNQSARYQDLALYEQRFGIPSQNFTVELIDGGVDNQTISSNHGEADLDVENIVGVAGPLPVREFITAGSPPFIPNLDEPVLNTNEPYIPYYRYLLSRTNAELPQVISNSYGDDEQTVPERYARRTCNLIGQLGLRGITVLESSGDTGVGAPCQSNDGKMTPQFTPQFPGTCPYITAVGGTQAIDPEIAWVAGSGGFSNYFTQPSYQTGAVNNYLTNHISPATLDYYKPYTNVAMRGFPDVSAHSLTPDYLVYVNNKQAKSGGTSAAAPVFASVIALLNDARLRAGKPTLGFINPWLYANGYKGLTDITAGEAVGCNGVNGQTGQPINGSIIPFATWNATVGWDPVTGLGVPNVGLLVPLALAA